MTPKIGHNGGQAFPSDSDYHSSKGMTLRQYAAIELRVPDSGTDWLDDMIRQAKRDDFAGQALAGIVADDRFEKVARSAAVDWEDLAGQIAYGLADATIAARGE